MTRTKSTKKNQKTQPQTVVPSPKPNNADSNGDDNSSNNSVMANVQSGIMSLNWQEAAQNWIYAGALTGSLMCACKKFEKMCRNEKWMPRDNATDLEIAMMGVYKASRIGFSAGIGAFVGGMAAATAPVSVPAYMYYLKQKDE